MTAATDPPPLRVIRPGARVVILGDLQAVVTEAIIAYGSVEYTVLWHDGCELRTQRVPAFAIEGEGAETVAVAFGFTS